MSTIRLGKITLKDPLILAPMAGVTTLAFRSICHEFGSSYQPTELVSARSIVYNGLERSFRYLMIDPSKEGITCIQLFGSEVSDIEYAIKAVCEDERLSGVDIIDINMGCPVPKVVKTGAGSALIKDPEKAAKITEGAVKAAREYGKALTVKTRLGFEDEDKYNGRGEDFIKALSEAGPDLIAVHGRTRSQMYHGQADIDALGRFGKIIKEHGIPFVANGDIKDTESARNVISKTGADGLMIGRAATGNPWIFRELKGVFGPETDEPQAVITDEERKEMLLRELTETALYKDEIYAVREMRPSMIAYVKGIKGAAKLKVRLCSAVTIEEIREVLWESEQE